MSCVTSVSVMDRAGWGRREDVWWRLGPTGWKWLGSGDVRWSERTELVCRMYVLV